VKCGQYLSLLAETGRSHMQNRPLRGEAALAVTPGLRFHGAWLFIEVTDAEREQIKLRAAAIDRVLTAFTTIGVLAPLAGTFLSGSAAVPADCWTKRERKFSSATRASPQKSATSLFAIIWTSK
jgi:hypothetical protein